MRNFIQSGNVVTATAPYNLTSGDGCLIGSMFGVACGDYASGDADAELAMTGVFDLAKATGEAWSAGARIYWDPTAKNCTTAASSSAGGNTLIGVAVASAGSSATSGAVRLNGSF